MATFKPGLGVTAYEKDRRSSPAAPVTHGTLFISEVIDSIAHVGTVRLASPMGGVIQGVPIGVMGNGIIGARPIGLCYPPHTRVVCYLPPGSTFCFVLGAIPETLLSNYFSFVPDQIVHGSTSGLPFDRVHWGALITPYGPSGDIPFSHGRPVDELPGDNGVINELGVSYGIGRTLAWLRASAACGIEAHWLDDLLRFNAYNLSVDTAGSELRALNDEGEWTEVKRWGPYPWETLGIVETGKDFTKHASNNWREGKAGREPINEDQQGLWRVQRFRGYLGDLERTLVSAITPDVIPEGTESTERLANSTILPGLLDVGFSIDGSYYVRSAKSILLEKTVAICIPKEKKLPEDPTGDTSTNYKAAGALGTGKDHDKQNVSIDDTKPGLRAAMLWERHALQNNFYRQIGIIRHERDWLLPEETQTYTAFKFQQSYPLQTLPELSDKTFWMPTPPSTELDIDHRGKTKYYAGRAAICIDDDGSISLEDAYGSQIKMSGGNIFISPKFDVVLQPGRNVQLWSPNDTIIKSGNSVDITASQGDVRIRADGNAMLASSTKGVLIESSFDPRVHGDATPNWNLEGEDVQSRGVLIRATNSSVTSLSKDVYIRSGAKPGTEVDGQLHIDAGGGYGKANVHGDEITLRATNHAQFILGSEQDIDSTSSLDMTRTSFVMGGKTLQNMTFGAAGITFGYETSNGRVHFLSDIFVNGRVWSTDDAVIGGDLFIDGSVASQRGVRIGGDAVFTGIVLCKNIAADDSSGFLGKTSDTFRAQDQRPPDHPAVANDILTTETERARSALQAEREADNAQIADFNERLYGADSIFASESLINNAVFTFRTPTQYGTDEEFVFFESRWQQWNRLISGNYKTWNESEVTSPASGRKTMPYPGYEVWNSEQSFGLIDDKFFDTSTGLSVSRATIDGSDKNIVARYTSLRSGYTITKQGNE